MSHHLTLVAEAKQAIQAVFADRSVSQATTRESLEELCTEIEGHLDAIEDDALEDDLENDDD